MAGHVAAPSYGPAVGTVQGRREEGDDVMDLCAIPEFSRDVSVNQSYLLLNVLK